MGGISDSSHDANYFGSASIVLIHSRYHSPLPLQAPDPALAIIAQGKLLESPHRRLVTIVENKARMTIGLRPKRSDARPHAIAVSDCAKLKEALVTPL